MFIPVYIYIGLIFVQVQGLYFSPGPNAITMLHVYLSVLSNVECSVPEYIYIGLICVQVQGLYFSPGDKVFNLDLSMSTGHVTWA